MDPEKRGAVTVYNPSPLAAHPAHSEPMFHAVTWNHQTKQVQAEQVVTSRGSEFGLLQRPGRDRLQRAVARLGVAFGTLRSQTPREFRADRGHVAPDLEMLFEAKLEEVRCAGLIQPMPLKVSDRHESTAKIFEEIWFSKQMLADKKVLTVLDVTWLQIGVQGMELLVDAVLASNCRKSLTSLLLGHNFIRDDGCRHLQRLLQSNSTITTLFLDNNDISEEGATFLGEALRRNSTLKTVGLSRNSIGHHGMKAVLDGIREAGYMRALNVTDNGFLPETYAMLSAGLTKNVLPLVSLTLSEGPRMVSSMQGNQLASLIGISLSKNTTLTSLNLPHNMIGDAGFQDIADSLPFNTSLVHLNCRGNQITAWGASKIALTFPSNSTLQSLDLSANDIRVTSETKALLESLHGNTSLKDLDLSSNLCHTATEAPVRAILERNNSFYKDQTADMHSFVSDMDQAIDAKQRRLDAAKKQAQHMMAKQQHAAELVRPLLNPPQQEALQVSRSPSTMLSDVGSEDMSRRKQLYPGNPARVYLHVNDPRRCGKGLLVSLPVGATAETLWTMVRCSCLPASKACSTSVSATSKAAVKRPAAAARPRKGRRRAPWLCARLLRRHCLLRHLPGVLLAVRQSAAG